MCNTPKYPIIPILTSHCDHDLEQKMANTFVCEDRVIPFYNENVEFLPIELSIRMGIFTPFDWTYVKNLQKHR